MCGRYSPGGEGLFEREKKEKRGRGSDTHKQLRIDKSIIQKDIAHQKRGPSLTIGLQLIRVSSEVHWHFMPRLPRRRNVIILLTGRTDR
jgi:hypothetical protein